MKTLFFIMVAFCLIGSGAQALTISPVRFNETTLAGSSVVFEVSLTPNNEQERTLETVSVTGDCSGWVSVTPEAPVNLPAKFKVTANIPADATNGRTRCDIAFVQPSQGMVSAIIEFPLTFNVSNGKEPTPAPVITTSSATPTPTETQTPIPTRTTYAPLSEWIVFTALIPVLLRYKNKKN